MGVIFVGQGDPRPAIALRYARKIAALDSKLAAERQRADSWNRIAYSENIAFNLGLERVSVPRLRLSSVKLKQGGDQTQSGGAHGHGLSSGPAHQAESAPPVKRERKSPFPLTREELWNPQPDVLTRTITPVADGFIITETLMRGHED